ncbi:unnamed protein product, partial [Discosporangium mesarthrocarpum]
LLREEQESGSDLAGEIDGCIRNGQLVPAPIIVALLKKAIFAEAEKPRLKFLVDGFPRSIGNLKAWFEAFSDDDLQVRFALYLDCPQETMRERLLERGKTSGRADDNAEAVLKRFATFEKESLPVVEALDRMGMVSNCPNLS